MGAVYLTIDQARAQYGDDNIAVAFDLNRDGLVDSARFDFHVELASRQIDSYLLGQVALPLANPPAIFPKLCLDLAIYNACNDASRRTDEMVRRADHAIRYLEQIAKGTIKLEIADNTPAPSLTRGADISIARADEYETDARQFTATTLRGVV